MEDSELLDDQAMREAELRRAVDDSERELGDAFAMLGKVSAQQFGLGAYVARHPWHWLLGACALGMAVSLNRK